MPHIGYPAYHMRYVLAVLYVVLEGVSAGALCFFGLGHLSLKQRDVFVCVPSRPSRFSRGSAGDPLPCNLNLPRSRVSAVLAVGQNKTAGVPGLCFQPSGSLVTY